MIITHHDFGATIQLHRAKYARFTACVNEHLAKRQLCECKICCDTPTTYLKNPPVGHAQLFDYIDIDVSAKRHHVLALMVYPSGKRPRLCRLHYSTGLDGPTEGLTFSRISALGESE